MPQESKKIKVLLVEDNSADVLLVREALPTCSGEVELTVASDGEQALQLLTQERRLFDLVILDLNIPKIDGLTVLKLFSPRTAPVVIFSACCTAPDAQRAFELGAADCAQKPLDLHEFIREVCRIIDQWTAPSNKAPQLATQTGRQG
jgi:CheY-like chemotaxis protein